METANILIIADDRLLLQALSDMLRIKFDGATVDTFGTLEEARERMIHRDYDIIVSDIRLSGIEGVTILEDIRSRRPNAVIFLLTEDADRELAVRAIAAGAYTFIPKPVDPDILAVWITRALQMRQISRSMEEQQAVLARYAKEAEQLEQMRAQAQELRHLAAHLEAVREEERTRIARELHDELGQTLTAIKLDLSWLERQISGFPAEASSLLLLKIRFMLKLTQDTIRAVQRISADLRPTILDKVGLPAAVEWQAQQFAQRAGLISEFDIDPRIVLDKATSVALFRTLQEILTNIARHAQATKVTIKLKQQNGSILMEVMDNGRGISKEQLSSSASLGITGMRERVRLMGGDICISGGPGQGTTVRISVPATNRR